MEDFKGTKGEWLMSGISMKGATHFNVIGTVLGGKHKVANVLYVYDGNASNERNIDEYNEAEANANLISAAPELLNLALLIKKWSGSMGADLDNLLTSTINKALGK